MTVEQILLRQYETWECTGSGYPDAWVQETHASELEQTGYPGDGPLLLPRIPDLVREQAGNRCLRCGHPYDKLAPGISKGGEWSPCDERCTHGAPYRWRDAGKGEDDPWRVFEFENAPPVGESLRDHGPGGEWLIRWDVEARWRILTVHHLDGDKRNCRWWNLAALCQRCHLRMQRAVIMDRVYHFEHSEWFKPFAAGFYAWKYERVELERDQLDDIMSDGRTRLERFLGYEHRFTQEAIF